MDMSKKGPHYTNILYERRRELLNRLSSEPDKEKWDMVKAKFAYDYGLREAKVDEYYRTLIKAGLINPNGNGH